MKDWLGNLFYRAHKRLGRKWFVPVFCSCTYVLIGIPLLFVPFEMPFGAVFLMIAVIVPWFWGTAYTNGKEDARNADGYVVVKEKELAEALFTKHKLDVIVEYCPGEIPALYETAQKIGLVDKDAVKH